MIGETDGEDVGNGRLCEGRARGDEMRTYVRGGGLGEGEMAEIGAVR